MSNQQSVWVGSINFTHVNIHSIGVSFSKVFDFPEYHFFENTPSEQDTEETEKRFKELRAIKVNLQDTFTQFDKLEVMPDSLWFENDKNELPQKTEYIFRVLGGGLILNEDCANILKQFNLGKSTLTPLQIYKLGTNELLIEETFYFLNSCEQRRYVKATQPEEYFTYDNHLIKNRTHRLKVEMADNHLEVEQSATDCDVDLWHDPCFSSGYFFSERLHNALVEAGLDKKWDMHLCKLMQ